MIRHVDKYRLKWDHHIAGKHVGCTIPIFVSRDGKKMSLHAADIQGEYICWELIVREDAQGQYFELPMTDEETTILLGRIIQH